ncbi:MAG: DUF1259 domain-containing protein [Thermoproteota archaeon]|nr:DUF1259 domain-containing protein [Thermoproteota archaeon]
MMNSKKLFFLLPVGLALLLCTSVLVASVTPTALGQQQPNSGSNQSTTTTTNTTNNTGTSTTGTLGCDGAASILRGQIVPNPAGACDITVPLQGLQVQDTATGASLNKLLVMNPLFEFLPTSNQTVGGSATTAATNQTTVYGFAEIGSMGGGLPLAMKMLANSSWNVVAVHNHVIGESPSMIFVHAIANGDINTLARDARAILDALMTQTQSPPSGNQTSTTSGSGGTAGSNMTANSTPSGVTGSTTISNGSTAGGGVGTSGGGTGSGPGVDTTGSGGTQ